MAEKLVRSADASCYVCQVPLNFFFFFSFSLLPLFLFFWSNLRHPFGIGSLLVHCVVFPPCLCWTKQKGWQLGEFGWRIVHHLALQGQRQLLCSYRCQKHRRSKGFACFLKKRKKTSFLFFFFKKKSFCSTSLTALWVLVADARWFLPILCNGILLALFGVWTLLIKTMLRIFASASLRWSMRWLLLSLQSLQKAALQFQTLLLHQRN